MKKGSKKTGIITDLLAHFLSDTAVIYVKTLYAHWNMVGTEFFMYHKLLEKQYQDLAEALDELAERMRMLRVKAPASMADYLANTSLKEFTKNFYTQEALIKELIKDHELLVAESHALIEESEKEKDQGTSDLMIERLRYHDKQAWLLRSHFN